MIRMLSFLKRTLLGGFLSLLLLTFIVPGGLAEAAPALQMPTPPFPVQATETLNVRAAPSTSAAIIGRLAPGQGATVVDLASGPAVLADNVTWFQIASGGYIYSGYTAPNDGTYNASPTGRWIEVDRVQEIARAWQNGRVVYTAPVTVGVPAFPTPVGSFTIIRRVANETMDSRTVGIPLSSPNGYYVTGVLFTQYFTNGGAALHLNYWSPAAAFGSYPTSHGCVGLRYADALFFWNFATIGTPVIVHD